MVRLLPAGTVSEKRPSMSVTVASFDPHHLHAGTYYGLAVGIVNVTRNVDGLHRCKWP